MVIPIAIGRKKGKGKKEKRVSSGAAGINR
jgi:hypothetical protein